MLLMCAWVCGGMLKGQTPGKDSLPAYLEPYEKAIRLIDSARFREAIPLLKKATKEKPDLWEGYNKMAFAQLQLKDHKGSLKSIDKAEKIAPMNFESQKLKAINYYQTEKYRECKVAIDTAVFIALEEAIEDAELYYYRALLMFKGKNYRGALESCEMAIEFNPKYYQAMVLKGEIRIAMKEYRHAIRALDEAIEKMPAEKTDYNAFKLRAKSKFEVADYRGVIRDLDVYLDGIPKEEEALISRAAAKINVDDNSGAIADLDEAIRINGKNPVSYCYRGVAKGGNKSFVEAMKDLDHAIKLKFDYPAAYVNRAAIKFAGKDKRGACEDLNKADGLGSETAYKLIETYCK